MGNIFRIDAGFFGAPAATAIARNPEHLDLFVTGTDDGVYSKYRDPGAGVLLGVTITFDTHNDNKKNETIVHVFVKNRLNNSLSPEEHSITFRTGPHSSATGRPATSMEVRRIPTWPMVSPLGQDDEFQNPSSRTFSLTLARPNISVNEVVLPVVNIHIRTDCGIAFDFDRWIFDYTVTLQFDTRARPGGIVKGLRCEQVVSEPNLPSSARSSSQSLLQFVATVTVFRSISATRSQYSG